ncbi:MAG: DUF1800 family protein [Saprospiraceae bacterium]
MLQPYSGPWKFEQAAHLLRRTIFGPTKARILQAVNDGMETTITKLLGATAPVDPPIYYDFSDDPTAGIGETWVDKPLDGNITGIYFSRAKTLWAWWNRQMRENDQTILEKMSLFWHNHFVVADAGGPNMNWRYLTLIREFSLGDFKELTKRITVDQTMLVYLNGTQNTKDEPNENYARELLELFTIGKGPLAGPGDYTNYTEQDIAAIAKALTGWVVWDWENNVPSEYKDYRHDTSDKQLSHRFDNQMITNQGEEEYKTVIDIIFTKDEVARHLCRRLYIWFVNYEITDTVETEVIQPMAQILIDNDYQVKPAMEALLKSEHFFSESLRGCMIKNTFDYFYSINNSLEIQQSTNILEQYRMWQAWFWELDELGMGVFFIPSVAGWRAYHQSPGYYREWINSASLSLRKRMLVNFKYLIPYVDDTLPGFDFLTFIETLDEPEDVNLMIDEICLLLFPRTMTAPQKAFFKEILIPGLPDFEWTLEYNEFLADPNNEEKRQAVESKLENMFYAMFGVPEFQLS